MKQLWEFILIEIEIQAYEYNCSKIDILRKYDEYYKKYFGCSPKTSKKNSKIAKKYVIECFNKHKENLKQGIKDDLPLKNSIKIFCLMLSFEDKVEVCKYIYNTAISSETVREVV